MNAYLDDPYITDSDWDAVAELMRGRIPSTRGSLVSRFELEMSNFLGVSSAHTIATSSGSAALRLALFSVAEHQSRVHTSALTYRATESAILHTGHRPVFHDVDQDTWLMRYTGPGVCIPVDLYGNVCRDAQSDVLISDSCEAFGADLGVYPFACLSFNGNKTLTTGAGGFLVCPSIDRRDRIMNMWVDSSTGGYNYRMPALCAALGLVQLRRATFLVERKERIYQEYNNLLGDVVRFQQPTRGSRHWMTAGTFPESVDIPTLQTRLLERGIPTRRVFRPLTTRGDAPVAWYIYDHGLCLPSSCRNSPHEIRHVCDAIKEEINAK